MQQPSASIIAMIPPVDSEDDREAMIGLTSSTTGTATTPPRRTGTTTTTTTTAHPDLEPLRTPSIPMGPQTTVGCPSANNNKPSPNFGASLRHDESENGYHDSFVQPVNKNNKDKNKAPAYFHGVANNYHHYDNQFIPTTQQQQGQTTQPPEFVEYHDNVLPKAPTVSEDEDDDDDGEDDASWWSDLFTSNRKVSVQLGTKVTEVSYGSRMVSRVDAREPSSPPPRRMNRQPSPLAGQLYPSLTAVEDQNNVQNNQRAVDIRRAYQERPRQWPQQTSDLINTVTSGGANKDSNKSKVSLIEDEGRNNSISAVTFSSTHEHNDDPVSTSGPIIIRATAAAEADRNHAHILRNGSSVRGILLNEDIEMPTARNTTRTEKEEGKGASTKSWKVAFWVTFVVGAITFLVLFHLLIRARRNQAVENNNTIVPVSGETSLSPTPTPSMTTNQPTIVARNEIPQQNRATQAPSATMPPPLPASSEDTEQAIPSGILSPAMTFDSNTIDQIRTRGFLRCGVLPEQPGFGVENLSTGRIEGFDADACRAVGAAVLGRDNNNVEFVTVSTQERFRALQSGDVDMLASLASQTMDRDVFETSAQAGFTFSIPYLYSGHTFGGIPPFSECADNLDISNTSCAELRICVEDGTTFAERIIEIIPNAGLVVVPSLVSVYQTFIEGFCNVIAGDVFEVAESVVRANGYTQEYELGQNVYTRELVGLVTRDDDARWSDFVNWVLQSLLAAEEQGITKRNAAAFATTEFFGPSFENLFIDAIATVGNYGEMYERHLQGILPRNEVNKINFGTSGLILGIPFGNVNAMGPGPVPGGTLERIRNRGHLKCGITRFPGFGEFDVASGTWKGLDVDFCRAVSAAIFNGVSGDIDFRVQPAAVRFTSLERGDVDLLSSVTTWNLERDVMEGTTGVGFSFSQPNFYDGIVFGGIPPFGNCADKLDTTSPECRDLRICVNDGTTTIIRVRELFAERFIVPILTDEGPVQGLINGQCNAVAGSAFEVVEGGVRGVGYDGPYETGIYQFSKEPLAVVTRQDDPQFTAFVNSIVSATFFAEERSIGLANPEAMPMVSLFGPFYRRMMIDAIQTVGNYGEIYARNLEHLVPRGGLNSANNNPLGAQHYPLPGI